MTAGLHPHRPYGGGRAEGLLHLFWSWTNGAKILAGTGCCPPRHVGCRVALDCGDCPSTVFGDSDVEAIDRLAEHRRTRHG